MRRFEPAEIQVVSQAVEIGEEVTANYFKMATSQWQHLPYDIKTLAELRKEEIIEAAFAQITRYSRHPRYPEQAVRWGRRYDYFKICLQDHNIMAAVERDDSIELLPLSLYIITHELVHVVRFCRFMQRFDARPGERQREEARVHEITQEALGSLNLPRLDYVLQVYQSYPPMEKFRDQGLSA